MANRVFFSFHYRDVAELRANVVRNHWVTKPGRNAAGFFDASIWETAKKTGPIAIKRLINSGLENTSVTCVLIGTETFGRQWVRYELIKSFVRGNKLLGVHINSIKGSNQLTKPQGYNPLQCLGVTFSADGLTRTLHERIGQQWRLYKEIDGTASAQISMVSEQYRGKSFNLARWCKIYEWVRDNGYNNFSKWVD